MDRTGADFFASVQSMVDRLGARPVPVQLPIGQEEHFRGVVDLVEMRAVVWQDDLGERFDVEEIPAELLEQAQEYHHQLIDAVADHDEELTETYLLDEESVTPDMLKRALRKATLDTTVRSGQRSARARSRPRSGSRRRRPATRSPSRPRRSGSSR